MKQEMTPQYIKLIDAKDAERIMLNPSRYRN